MNLNSTNAKSITVKARWTLLNYIKNYDYTGGEQTFSSPYVGYYKLEVWGASGGNATYAYENKTYQGGYGGYATGIVDLAKTNSIYVNVGGQGKTAGSTTDVTAVSVNGGYNGGGNGLRYYPSTGPYKDASSGGGATHIAKVSGDLANLEDQKGTLVNNSYYVSDTIFIVAGGGGGIASYYDPGSPLCRGVSYAGNGGGIAGRTVDLIIASDSNCWKKCNPTGGTQTNGGIGCSSYSTTETITDSKYIGAFGKGASNVTTSQTWGGGGGGWYGGATGEYRGGGGGSGYIGSSNLISGLGVTKHMTCYSCTTSTADATRTNSNTTTPTSTPIADVARIGNGYARITWMGDKL